MASLLNPSQGIHALSCIASPALASPSRTHAFACEFNGGSQVTGEVSTAALACVLLTSSVVVLNVSSMEGLNDATLTDELDVLLKAVERFVCVCDLQIG